MRDKNVSIKMKREHILIRCSDSAQFEDVIEDLNKKIQEIELFTFLSQE